MQMASDRCVYLHRLKNGCVFYVGIGSDKRAYSSSNRNRHWRSIVAEYRQYDVIIIGRNLTVAEAGAIEKIWIAHIGLDRLANISVGGQASAFGMRHTAEAKAKISRNTAARRPDVRAKKSRANSGVNNPMFGRSHSPETREKLAEMRRGKPLSAETRQRMSAAHIARNRSGGNVK